MPNRRRFIKILSLSGVAVIGGYGFYRYKSVIAKNIQSQLDFENSNIKLVEDWILSAEETRDTK